jgi:hypothetical protein
MRSANLPMSKEARGKLLRAVICESPCVPVGSESAVRRACREVDANLPVLLHP